MYQVLRCRLESKRNSLCFIGVRYFNTILSTSNLDILYSSSICVYKRTLKESIFMNINIMLRCVALRCVALRHPHCDEQSTIFIECAHLLNNNLCFCMLKVINAEISIAHILYAVQLSQITTGIRPANLFS